MKTTQITTTIIEVEDANNWLTQRENENILLTTFTKKVIVENEEDTNDWIEITNDEKTSIENEIKKIIGEEEHTTIDEEIIAPTPSINE